MRIQWDPAKAAANLRSHGVSFVEAQLVFEDEHALFRDDPDHSADEERFILLGLGECLRLLVVCYTFRDHGETIRIISARKASPAESKVYDERVIR